MANQMFKATVKTKVPTNTCHPEKKVLFDAGTNPAAPVWKCECGKVLENIAPENIVTVAV
jgi:hypothetical protein